MSSAGPESDLPLQERRNVLAKKKIYSNDKDPRKAT